MKHRWIIPVLALLLVPGRSGPAQAAPGYDKVADYSDTASPREVGVYGMTPIAGAQVADGTYVVKTECSSPFFRILEAKLTVKDGQMEAVLTMSSASYLYVYPGSAAEAAAAPLTAYIPMEEKTGRYTFTIPVRALNEGLPCAAYSKNREKWYSRQILFDAASLPEGALDFAVPDYQRIEKALRLYEATYGAPEETQTDDPADAGAREGSEAAAMEEDDGEYSIEVDMSGGSGRASVTSPTWLYVRDGLGYAKLLWSSSYYDYMIVDGTRYDNETTDGSNSTFTIPITRLNEPMAVIADTTAMGDPLEIEYTLTFYADTVGAKGRIPQEAAKKVLVIAVTIMVLGGIVNAWVKKKRAS